MAFWVVDGGRSQGATGRGLYFHGGKRRVSQSDGGDSGDTFDNKRTRFADGELSADGCGSAPSRGGYDYGNDDRHGNPHGNPHAGIAFRYGSAPGDSFNYPIDDDRYHHDYDHDRDIEATPPPLLPPNSMHEKNLGFFVIRECSPTPELPPISPLGFEPGPASDMGPVLSPPGPGPPLPGACDMERTQSGLSISSDTTQNSLASLGTDDNVADFISDFEAARVVRDHIAGLTRRRRCPDSQHGRILKVLINPKSNPRGSTPDWPLDNDALRSIFSAANELFFAKRLTGRVAWDWSHPASAQYQAHIVGTTALRRSCQGGYETLIVLSSPILTDTKYNRRLLISTFLHEMIHSYLFVTCGLKAGKCGGHTPGFRQIAEMIDDWVGRGYLRLGEMEADLEQFRELDERTYDNKRDNCAVDEEWRTHGSGPWRRRDGRAERDRDDYYPIEPRPHHQPQQPQQQQHRHHPRHEEWQWQEREGFLARVAKGGGSPYV